MSSTCVFCRIASGDEDADILYATETVIAFRDTRPQAPVHVQLIPKEHVASLVEVEERHAGVLADIVQGAQQIARAEGIDESGWRLVANVGRDAGQHVFHLHFHLLGGRAMGWPPG